MTIKQQPKPAEAVKDRRAEALRENLRKRKEQMVKRTEKKNLEKE